MNAVINAVFFCFVLCATVRHGWGRRYIYKRRVWPSSYAFLEERRAADPRCVHRLLTPGDPSHYPGSHETLWNHILRIWDTTAVSLVTELVFLFRLLLFSFLYREVFICFSWWTSTPPWFPLCSWLSLKLQLSAGSLVSSASSSQVHKFKCLFFWPLSFIPFASGVSRISLMIERMLGKAPNIYFRLCWKFFSPVLVLVRF